jgi:hypothetical protein
MVSKNGVAVVMFLASMLGITLVEAQVIEALAAITTLISFALMIWNQWQREDVKWFIFKK